jgi:hypothetical protein
MEPERIPKQSMDHTPRGTRSVENLKLRGKDQPILQRNGKDRQFKTLMMMAIVFYNEVK